MYLPFDFYFIFCYLSFEQQRECKQGGGQREREGDTESEAGSGLRAVSTEPDAGLEPTSRETVT